MEIIAGVDEAGRGPLAGPVVAAAVILSDDKIEGLRDSKKLSAKKREFLFQEININKGNTCMQNIGEEIVGEYLKILRGCDFVEYNLYTPDVQGEIEGINRLKQRFEYEPENSKAQVADNWMGELL